MPKGFKRKNAGVGVDFKRVKHKVGKKLVKAQNETDTTVVSKSITLPEQSIAVDKGGAAVTHRNLSLKDLLSQCSHHNDRVRCEALKGLIELLKANPKEAQVSALHLLTTVATRFADHDESCRAAVKQLLQGALLPALGRNALAPFFPVLLAHVNAALTHLAFPIRMDAMACLEVLMDYRPASIEPEEFTVVLEHFISSLSRKSRGGGVSLKTGSLQSLLTIITKLYAFLNKAFPKAKAPNHDGHTTHNAVGLPLGARRCGWATTSTVRIHNGGQHTIATASVNLFRVLCEECWAECTPDSFNTAPEEDSALCAAGIVQSCLLLVDRFGEESNTFFLESQTCFDRIATYFPIRSPDSKTVTRRTEQGLIDINVGMAQLLVRFKSHQSSSNIPGGFPDGSIAEQSWRRGMWKDRVERLIVWLEGVFEHGSALQTTMDTSSNAINTPVDFLTFQTVSASLAVASELLRVSRLESLHYVEGFLDISRILRSIMSLWKRTAGNRQNDHPHVTKIITAMIDTFLLFDAPELEYCMDIILHDLLKVLWMSLQSRSNPVRSQGLAYSAFTLLLKATTHCRGPSKGLLEISETIGALFCYPHAPGKKRKKEPKRAAKFQLAERQYCAGPVASLSLEARTLAVDVLYHLPGLSHGILETVKAVALEMSEDEYPENLAVRLIDMVVEKSRSSSSDLENISENSVLDFIVDLCGGVHGYCRLQDNSLSWKRHVAVVEAALRWFEVTNVNCKFDPELDQYDQRVANRLLEALDQTFTDSENQKTRRICLAYSLLQLSRQTGSFYVDNVKAWGGRVMRFLLDCMTTSCFVPPLEGDVHSTARFVLNCMACDEPNKFQIMEKALDVDRFGSGKLDGATAEAVQAVMALVQAWVATLDVQPHPDLHHSGASSDSNVRNKERGAAVLNRVLHSLALVVAVGGGLGDGGDGEMASLRNEYRKTSALVSGALGELYEAPLLRDASTTGQ